MLVSRALWYTAKNEAQIVNEELGDLPQDFSLVKTLFSGISRGTESIISSGRVHMNDHDRMRAPFMEGHFPFPVKYGYASVGQVLEGDASLIGKTVFSLSPHQSYAQLPNHALFAFSDIPPRRALLAANLETALNAVWNGQPGPSDHIGIVGGGVVGLLTGYLCAKLPGAQVHLVDIDPQRKQISETLGMKFSSPQEAPENCDVVFHCSASSEGLQTAIEMAGDEASIVEMSWFGSGPMPIELGGSFHSRQLKLICAQVGRVAQSHRARWSYARRLQAALELLVDPLLDGLIEEPIALDDVPERLPFIFSSGSGLLCQPISYPHSTL